MMTDRPDDPPAGSATCAITLLPVNAQQIVGSDMTVSGAISVGGVAQPGATGTFTLLGGALFNSTGAATCDVTADDVGQIPPETFTWDQAGLGKVRLTPTSPAGAPGLRDYTFINGSPLPTVGLEVDRNQAPANGFSEIVATASLTNAGVAVTDGSILFELPGLSSARFADDDSGQSSKVVPVDGRGQAVVAIVDTVVQQGAVRASAVGKYSQASPGLQDIAFTVLPDLTLSLSPRTVTFNAAEGGAVIAISVTGTGGIGVPYAPVNLSVIGGDAYFDAYNSNATLVVTNADGKASVTLNAFTWGGGLVFGSVEMVPPGGSAPQTAVDQVSYTSAAPPGLSLNISAIEYATDGAFDSWTSLDAKGATCAGGPATLSGRVRVSAQYMLRGAPWNGYGDMVFSVDAQSHAQLMAPFALPPDPPVFPAAAVTATYNPPQPDQFVPDNSETGHAPAQVWMQDGVTETALLALTPGPGAESARGNSAPIVFGQAWAGVTKVVVNFVGGGGQVAGIYQNGLHQAAIQVVLTLEDVFAQDLTDDNRPTAQQVMDAVQLMDFGASSNYSMAGRPAARGQFAFVGVGQTSNCFDKQIPAMSGMTPVRAAMMPDDGPTFYENKATISYYLVFNDQGSGRLPGTTVGMVVNPAYPYAGGKVLKFNQANGADSATTVQINSRGTLAYADSDLLQSVIRRKGPSETDAGPNVYNGNDAAGNYVRLWDITVSLRNSRYGVDLFGAFLPSSSLPAPGDAATRSTADSVFYDVKRGAFQTKAYLWQENNYLVSEDDYDDDAMDSGVGLTVPAGQNITLDGVASLSRQAVGAGEIGITVAAGFGDLGPSAGTWKPMAFKLVDRYGNATDEYRVNLALPQPPTLLGDMANGSWLPLTSAAPDDAPEIIADTGVTISRVATVDAGGSDYGNQKKQLGWDTTPSAGQSFVGGLPATFISPGTSWVLEQVNAATSNNEKLYGMSGTFQGATTYITTFNSKDNNSSGYHMVIGVTDAGKRDYIQLKPCWNTGTAMIFATKSAGTPTDGTCWQWSGTTDQKNLFNVMVFGYPYGAPPSQMALWTFDVYGQSKMTDPPAS